MHRQKQRLLAGLCAYWLLGCVMTLFLGNLHLTILGERGINVVAGVLMLGSTIGVHSLFSFAEHVTDRKARTLARGGAIPLLVITALIPAAALRISPYIGILAAFAGAIGVLGLLYGGAISAVVRYPVERV